MITADEQGYDDVSCSAGTVEARELTTGRIAAVVRSIPVAPSTVRAGQP